MGAKDGSEQALETWLDTANRALIFASMSGEAQLMLMIAGVHLIGLGCVAVLLIPALREGPQPPQSPEPGGEDGWGRGPGPTPLDPTSPRGGLPLPDAVPAGVRLRDHRRLRDLRPARERRPAREPRRVPVRSQ
jgi:hypothetical protein